LKGQARAFRRDVIAAAQDLYNPVTDKEFHEIVKAGGLQKLANFESSSWKPQEDSSREVPLRRLSYPHDTEDEDD
jgi:hypothetical protein